SLSSLLSFFSHATATSDIYTLSLHDALPISDASAFGPWKAAFVARLHELGWIEGRTIAVEYRWSEGRPERYAEIAAEFVRLNVEDRKSTRLNSSHVAISYAVFCLKKKKI